MAERPEDDVRRGLARVTVSESDSTQAEATTTGASRCGSWEAVALRKAAKK